VPNGEGKPSFQSEKKQKSISLREIFICLTIALLGQAPDPKRVKSTKHNILNCVVFMDFYKRFNILRAFCPICTAKMDSSRKTRDSNGFLHNMCVTP
jgi:hypothetical protein